MTNTRVHTPTPTIADVLAGRKKGRLRRTHQPVRRNSRHRGEREPAFWRPVDPLELRAVREAAELHDLIGKKAGKRNGPLGHIGIQVLTALMSVVQWSNGRLDPSIDWIAARIRRARSAVIRALKRLKEEGFLDWLRRSETIEDAEGAGPRVRQISNAYRIEVPSSWTRRVAQRIAQWRLRKRGTQAIAEPDVRPIEDPDLAAALARFGEAVSRSSASPPKGLNPGAE